MTSIKSQLTYRPISRSILDVGQWRSAMIAADNGYRKKLYDLYEDIMLDNVLADAIDKRIEAITNADIVFTLNDKPVDVVNDFMETEAFERLVTEILNAKFWGKSVIELLPDENGSIGVENIPRAHINTTKGIITKEWFHQHGWNYVDDPFFITAGGDKDFGIILRLCPYAIYKRGGFGDWSQFAELFGQPFRVGKYNSYDEDTRQKLFDALVEAGSSPVAVIPKEGDIEFVESKSSGNGILFKELKNACNEEMLIGVLGQIMTTLSGSSHSQSETHMNVQQSKHKADRRFVTRILNTQLLPFLIARGWPVEGGSFSIPEKGQTISLEKRIDIDLKVAGKVPIPASYFYKTYGIPMPRGNEQVVHTPTTQPEGNGEHGFFQVAPLAGAMPTMISNGNRLLLQRVWNKESTYWDDQLFQDIASQLSKALHKGLKKGSKTPSAVAVSYGATPDGLITAFETNIFHFSSAKTLVEVQELNKIFRDSKSFADFEKEASKKVDIFNKEWAQTEWNSAYHIGEAAATYNNLIKDTELFPYWQYKTVADDKVREDHAELHNLILPANDPRWDKIYPPNGWNCRCYIVPLTAAEAEELGFKIETEREKADTYLNSNQFQKEKAQGFGVNRGKTEEIFSANQMYIRKFPDNASKYLDKLQDKHWNLNTVNTEIKQSLNSVKTYEGTAADWWNKQKHNGKGLAVLTDYNKRSVVINKKDFDIHTSDKVKKRAHRSKLLTEVENIVAAPDEIWINNYSGKKFDEYVLLKFYKPSVDQPKGNMIAVVMNIEGNEILVKTWFDVVLKKDVLKQYRRGLLVKKKGN